MRMPFSPFFTLRPSWFHAYSPATFVAVGRCLAISKTLPKDYVHWRTMLSVGWKALQGACFLALRLT
jgi:hypothetical protein